MPVTYLNRQILAAEEFIAEREAGWFNPNATYEGYLEMVRSQVTLAACDRTALAAQGIEVRGPEPDLSPAMEAILDKVWAEVAEQRQPAADTEEELTALAA
ncbi:MAG: hypothetical protein HOP19_27515 [Acidobacteria bacterium]|nr:hypothetical protein [Acidobacteriota bacterium]